MKYITTVQTAEKWGISLGRVLKLARDGRILGAKQFGNRWMIPENAKKPVDNRTKESKSEHANTDNFRFFLYSTKDADAYNPPLTEEELRLKKVFYATHACHFNEALAQLRDLPFESDNRYNRIYALYCACIITFINNKPYSFFDYYGKLVFELQEDFPHKKEINMLWLELNAILGKTSEIEKDLYFESLEGIYTDCLPHLASFVALSYFYSGKSDVTPEMIQSLEINCAFIENLQTEQVDLQTMHMYLGVLNEMINNQAAKEYHFRRVFKISEENELYWLPSMQYHYLGSSFENALQNCSPTFIKKIEKYSLEIQKRRESFMRSFPNQSIFDLLPKKKYLFVNYAMRGFMNKEVAKLMNISEKAVEKTYSMIYETLGVGSKKELIEYIKKLETDK